MTMREIERDVLSLRCWLRRTVLPTALFLMVALLAMQAVAESETILNHRALIVGFFAIYFVLVRGGHMIMVRSLHTELKRKYPEPYAERLARLPDLRGRNAGFALARLKRRMIDDGVISASTRKQDGQR